MEKKNQNCNPTIMKNKYMLRRDFGLHKAHSDSAAHKMLTVAP